MSSFFKSMIQNLPIRFTHPYHTPAKQMPIVPINAIPSGLHPRKRNPFTAEEDQKILDLVQLYQDTSKVNWYFIATQLQGRNVRQCRERYQLFLSDGIKRKVKWTSEEDEILLKQYQVLGPRWKQMESFFEGRTSYSIKNRFISLTRHNSKSFGFSSTTKCTDSETEDTDLKISPDVNIIQPNQQPPDLYTVQCGNSTCPEISAYDMDFASEPDFDLSNFDIFGEDGLNFV